MKTKLLKEIREDVKIKYKEGVWKLLMASCYYEFDSLEELIKKVLRRNSRKYTGLLDWPWRSIYNEYNYKIEKRKFDK